MSYFLENEEVEKVEEVKEQDGIASIEPLLDNRIAVSYTHLTLPTT